MENMVTNVEQIKQFKSAYQGKKVLITGNTGFKGSWLTMWLLHLGAEVYGISDKVPTTPSLFEVAKLKEDIHYYEFDILDIERLKRTIETIKPDFIFHLAAQAIVSESFNNPINTFSTNLMGSVHVLESLRLLKEDLACNVIMITSDKCYENVEWSWGYRENDYLGGKDPYSASKACAEIALSAYYRSFFSNNENIRIVSARAGNVIGGGDWAKDRLVPDCFRAWANGEKVTIRNPHSTRPWQLVLEPLSGYLHLAQRLSMEKKINGESFNFGPKAEQDRSVLQVLRELAQYLPLKSEESLQIKENTLLKEAGLLKLNCDKALAKLEWLPTLSYEETMQFTGSWYQSFYTNVEMKDFSVQQLKQYCNIANDKKIIWTS